MKMLEKIFSVKNDSDFKHKVVTIFYLKLKFKRKIKSVKIKLPEWMGIGNRVFAMVNCVHLFHPENIDVYWENTKWVNSPCLDLFDMDFNSKINETSSKEECNSWHKAGGVVMVDTPKIELTCLDGTEINLKYNDLTRGEINEFRHYFSCIKPSKAVQEVIDKMRLPKKYVALQIRNNKDWDDYKRNSDLSQFDKAIEAYPKDTVFFLSAMNEQIAQRFVDKYKNRIIVLQNKNYRSMVHAVADLYIMSYSKEAIYSYGSTFSELAFWLGGAKQNVKIIGDNQNWIDTSYLFDTDSVNSNN